MSLCHAKLCYMDVKDETTNRTITVISLYQGESGYGLNAYCHLREAFRTFLCSRIIEFVDLDTGEVIADIPHHLQLIIDRKKSAA